MGNNNDTYYQPLVDPFDSDNIPEYFHVQSDHYAGGFADVTAPAAANFPHATPTRYFVELPMAIDVSDLTGTRPILIYDVDTTTLLTRVAGAPGANEYRIPPATSSWRNVIEINSAQAGDVLGFDYYGLKSVINAERANYIYNSLFTGTVALNSTITGTIHGDPAIDGDPSFTGFPIWGKGKQLTNYYYTGAGTPGVLYDRLAVSLINIDDSIIVTGMIAKLSGANTEVGIISRAKRTTSTNINVYGYNFYFPTAGGDIAGFNQVVISCQTGQATPVLTLDVAW